MAWAIEAANKAAPVDRVIVSTDNAEIASVARRYGAETPFARPKHLATDTSPTLETVLHAARWLRDQGTPPSTPILILQPTSPLRTGRDIEKALEILEKKRAGSVVSVKPIPKDHPWWSLLETPGGSAQPAFPDKLKLTRQKLPRAFTPNGAIYLARLGEILKKKRLYIPPIYPYVMEPARSVDIDTAMDLAEARLAFEKYR